MPAESDLEKEKKPVSLDNHLTQRQLSNNDLHTEPTLNNDNKNMGIKMTDIPIPNYPNKDDESQKRALQYTKDAPDDYVKLQNQTINSFQGAFTPLLDTTNNMLLTSQTFWSRVMEIYSESSALYTENAIALGKMINEIATANISAFNRLFSIQKGN